MDVLLVSGRYLGAEDPQRDEDARIVAELRHASVALRRLDVDPERTSPGFRAVEGRIADPLLERRLTVEIRQSKPSVVHQLGFGGAASALVPWVCERLGVPCVVSLRSPPVLCHRGDLMHAGGRSCEDWQTPVRCQTCLLTATTAGVSTLQGWLGRTLDRAGLPSPFPTTIALQNRWETVIGGLRSATVMVVAEELDRQRLVDSGLPADRVRLGETNNPTFWQQLYTELATVTA